MIIMKSMYVRYSVVKIMNYVVTFLFYNNYTTQDSTSHKFTSWIDVDSVFSDPSQ